MQLTPAIIACLAACALAEKTVTVTTTQQVTSTATVYTAAPQGSCTSAAELTGFTAHMGWDPLTVTGTGSFIGASTPSNDSANAYSGSGYLIGHFAPDPTSSSTDSMTLTATNLTLTRHTSYSASIAAKFIGTNTFCQLYVSAGDLGGQRFDIESSYQVFSIAFSSGTKGLTSVTWEAVCFANGPGRQGRYAVLWDEAGVLSEA